MDSALLANFILSMMLKKIQVPTQFQAQCEAIESMLQDDVTGLIDVLTDFAVESATVDFTVEANNEKLNELFSEWLETVNMEYGTVPMGIKALATEYYKERWKGSSFPILKIAKWGKFGDIMLPTKMFFIDGSSIHAQDTDEKEAALKIGSYQYFIGDTKDYPISSDSAIINRPYGRWFDKYPTPYLIKRGVYHNYRLIASIKNKEAEILEQVIPYLLLIKKGSPELFNAGKTYSQAELQEVVNQFQDLIDDLKTIAPGDKQIKVPTRATQYDEDIKQLIPDLEVIFKSSLFEQAERNILSGLGFIDVIQGISDSRRESVLNPKVFMQEVNSGVDGFKEVLRQLLVLIKQKNSDHIKYNNSKLYICSSPIKTFMTDDFKDKIRMLYDRGGISIRTYVELVGEVDFDTEKYRREKEAKDGTEYTMYPHLTKNDEDKGIDLQGKNPDGETAKPKNKETGKKPEDFTYASEDEEYIEEDEWAIETSSILSEDEEVALVRAYAPRVTENYIRLRQQDPNKFDKETFRTITISPSKGIKAIVGKKPGQKTTEIQSYLFQKDAKWTVKKAKEWEQEHATAYASIVNKHGLVTAPYTTVAELPPAVKKLDVDKQRAWLDIFNNAYRYMLSKTGSTKTAETYAFRVAWSKVKKVNVQKSFWEKLREKFKK